MLAFLASAAALTTSAAQPPADSTRGRHDEAMPAWFSLGVGHGSSFQGDVAGRAAFSLAVNPLIVFTLSATGVGSIDGDVASTALLAGVRTPRPDAFLFASAGPANVQCGSGCRNQTGVTFEAGYHIGVKYAGVSLVGFVVRAPARANSAGVVVALDLGWFDRR